MKLSDSELKLISDTIAMVSADGVEKAKSGHPGMPMGAADVAAVLWFEYLQLNPRDTQWINRDRFVLSNGHGSMLLYALLALSGTGLTLEDLKSFRQLHSKTAGHPEFHLTPGVEATTGPLGQGISNAVGMAIGEKLLAAQMNTASEEIISHRVFCMVGDGCLMEGISSEASSIAGHLGLGNLIVLFDDNHISIAGDTKLAFTEDVLKRYEAYGWQTARVDGHNYAEIRQALAAAVQDQNRPSIIACRTIIGKDAPHKANTGEVHGSPLGKDELEATKKIKAWPLEPSFYVPDQVKEFFCKRAGEWQENYDAWQKKFSSWKSQNAEKAERLTQRLNRTIPKNLDQKFLSVVPSDGKAISTRKLSSDILQVAAKELEFLVGGSADLEPSCLTLIKDSTDVQSGQFTGRNLRFGVREHAMGAIGNGLAYYGGFIPYGSTFLCFFDYQKPSVRLAALSELQNLFIYTHDSIFLGEDGPTHQPIEHVNALRMIPNMRVFRPADGLEVAVAYAQALEHQNGPAALILTRQNLEPIKRSANVTAQNVRCGGYVVLEAGAANLPLCVLVATGSEVSLACKTVELLPKTYRYRVVSMPCVEIFKSQDRKYRDEVIPKTAKIATLEAGSTFGWLQHVEGNSQSTLTVGIDSFGASAPAEALAEYFGFTPQKVAERIEKELL
ncbi:transketolase [bacterium]|nr:transketolase [bacterium]